MGLWRSINHTLLMTAREAMGGKFLRNSEISPLLISVPKPAEYPKKFTSDHEEPQGALYHIPLGPFRRKKNPFLKHVPGCPDTPQ